ncbi:hypothetical protein Pyn_28161 [Prunus yedoensis var. nudiflora]|uniref:Uncharacterized protein n=1 Tax=Prunus yedoensis var. nudiflora TaxID=2094558 RepID=A0A314ZHQ9_PRUYE|nr:hypothetical protein Pyn_28161 [Prunus yedoensis var. nudiflora]
MRQTEMWLIRPSGLLSQSQAGLIIDSFGIVFTAYSIAMPHSDGYMAATLEISTFSTIFLFLLFLPQSAAKTTACGSSTCKAGGLLGLISHVTT